MLNDLRSTDSLRAEDVSTYYLYQYQLGESQAVFAQIEEEMAELNDFCYFCLDSLATHVQGLQNKLTLYQKGELKSMDGDGEDATLDSIWSLKDFDIPLWNGMQKFIVRAMCFIMLSAFVEKSLKDVVTYLMPKNASKHKRVPGEGEISSLLRCLKEGCKIDFEEPVESFLIREKCRRIRNDFAHGSWQKIKDEVGQQSLLEAFMAVTTLFYVLDEATKSLE